MGVEQDAHTLTDFHQGFFVVDGDVVLVLPLPDVAGGLVDELDFPELTGGREDALEVPRLAGGRVPVEVVGAGGE